MRYSPNKECNDLITNLVRSGWSFAHGKKHDKVTAPNGRLLVVSRSPSTWRNIRYMECEIRKIMRG